MGRDQDECECGHERDDHLAGPCQAMTDKWHRCTCVEYEQTKPEGSHDE